MKHRCVVAPQANTSHSFRHSIHVTAGMTMIATLSAPFLRDALHLQALFMWFSLALVFLTPLSSNADFE